MPPRSTVHPGLRKLGHHVRELRKAMNWSQEELAGESGLDRSYVSGLEVGRRNPTYLVLLKLARVFRIPVTQLVDVE